jgi:hypothetical protein
MKYLQTLMQSIINDKFQKFNTAEVFRISVDRKNVEYIKCMNEHIFFCL